MKKLIMTSVAAVLAAGAATAQDVSVIVDADADDVVTYEEYEAGLMAAPETEGWVDIWDYDFDQDDVLTREEYARGMWTHYDVTGDNTWSPDELKAWEEDQLRYQATRSGREISPPG